MLLTSDDVLQSLITLVLMSNRT